MSPPIPLSPGQRAAGRGAVPDEPDKGPSVSQALTVLERAASSPRAHAAVKTLRAELEGDDSKSQPSRPSDTPNSPGMKSAASHMPPWAKK